MHCHRRDNYCVEQRSVTKLVIDSIVMASLKVKDGVNLEVHGAQVLVKKVGVLGGFCLLYTSPSPRDATLSRMPSSA